MQKYLTKQLFTKTNNCHAVRLVEKKKKRLLQTFAMLAAVLADSDARYHIFV